jgi:hypothetical protein
MNEIMLCQSNQFELEISLMNFLIKIKSLVPFHCWLNVSLLLLNFYIFENFLRILSIR